MIKDTTGAGSPDMYEKIDPVSVETVHVFKMYQKHHSHHKVVILR